MGELKYPHLFEPITLGRTFFKNRLFASPTGYQNVAGDGILPLGAAAYYGRKAMGGVASVASCELIVDEELGRGGSNHVCLDNPRAITPLCRVANAISRYGAVATAELQHSGMYAHREFGPLGPVITGKAYGPVECEIGGRVIEAMSEEMIERTINKYAEAAAAVKRCGFGMILIHAGHGWLLHQFLSPKVNTRKDKWGGPDIENRARLTVSVCDAVRRAVGTGFPIEIRISGSECYDGGYGIEEGIAFSKQLEGHVDLIHVSAGNHEVEEVFAVTHPSMFIGEGPNVKYAAEIKKNVKVPVATVGALGDPEMMEEIIASGKADVIEMARSLLADPDLPNKILLGKENEIKPCMRCLSCFSAELTYGEPYCAVNPECGHELEMMHEIPEAKIKKKVLIAGGGIGGMQAALTCAGRGHVVILCEKGDKLGGSITCEKDVPFKKNLDLYIERQRCAVSRAGIDVRMNTEVTPEYAGIIGADVIIAALGARPVKPPIPGIDGQNVVGAEFAYVNPDKVGQNVVVLGAGLVGLELGIYLAILGRKVTVVEMLDHINDGGNFLHITGLKVELKKRGIEINFKTAAKEIRPDGVVCKSADEEKFFAADTVIYAVGQRSLREEALALKSCAPEFYMLGDCITAKNITNATEGAFNISRNIGRV